LTLSADHTHMCNQKSAYFGVQMVCENCFKVNTSLHYTELSVLVLGIGIARGQYYWTLSGLLDIILTILLYDQYAITDDKHFIRAYNIMITMLSGGYVGLHLVTRNTNEKLRESLGLESVIRKHRLRWFGHNQHNDDAHIGPHDAGYPRGSLS